MVTKTNIYFLGKKKACSKFFVSDCKSSFKNCCCVASLTGCLIIFKYIRLNFFFFGVWFYFNISNICILKKIIDLFSSNKIFYYDHSHIFTPELVNMSFVSLPNFTSSLSKLINFYCRCNDQLCGFLMRPGVIEVK